MTRDDVRAAARRVTRWHERFAGLFGRKEPQGHSLVYVKGLMSGQKRKSVEPMALQFARGPNGAAATQNDVVALQGTEHKGVRSIYWTFWRIWIKWLRASYETYCIRRDGLPRPESG